MPNKEEDTKNKEPRRKAMTDRTASDRQAETSVLNKHGYKVLESVGKGSFADVRMAFSSAQKKTIAVKIISKDKITDKDFIRKFVPREIRVLRQLNHPNIIKFYKSIETVKTIFIFMELAENGDLLQIIKKEKMIDEKRACRWFHHLVDGVAHLHSRGVTHRDLKCENLLLDKYYVIKITDFGFTRDGLPNYLLEGQEENKNREIVLSNTFCGSFAYASPEVLKGIPYEPNMSDVWSMGVVLYIMVYGRLPFDDTNWNGLLKQVSEPVGFPSAPEVSDTCKSFIQDILSPLSIRIYIPEIRLHQWYTKTWDPQLERAYQRKYRWEEERIKTKGFEQIAYKGKGKDITRYERAATLRRFISEKEKFESLKKKVKEEEEAKNKATELQDATRTEGKLTDASGHSEDKNLLTTSSGTDKKQKEDIAGGSGKSITPLSLEQTNTTSPSKKIKQHSKEPIKINRGTELLTDNIDIAAENQPNEEVGKATLGATLPISRNIDMAILEEDEKRTYVGENTMPMIVETEVSQPERLFKDINEAILERNKLVQLSSSSKPTSSRMKEISSHRFCRKEDDGTFDDVKGKEGPISFLKLTDEASTLKEAFATDMVLEAEEDPDKDAIIEVVEMPETLEEQEFKQIEIKTTDGTVSHLELLQMIKQIEDDPDLENEELVMRYRRYLQEEEEANKQEEEDAKLSEEARQRKD